VLTSRFETADVGGAGGIACGFQRARFSVVGLEIVGSHHARPAFTTNQ
jgi:hypothetical protein